MVSTFFPNSVKAFRQAFFPSGFAFPVFSNPRFLGTCRVPSAKSRLGPLCADGVPTAITLDDGVPAAVALEKAPEPGGGGRQGEAGGGRGGGREDHSPRGAAGRALRLSAYGSSSSAPVLCRPHPVPPDETLGCRVL